MVKTIYHTSYNYYPEDIFWDVATYSMVETNRRYIALMMVAINASETSVNFYQSTRRSIPEDSNLNTRRRENLKYHQFSSHISYFPRNGRQWYQQVRAFVCPL
jgi:hypothetical protein